MKRIRGLTVTLVAASLAAAACASPGAHGEVLVSTASSLADAFEALEVAFEAADPEVNVVLNLDGSSALREQILAGAPVDVFASADPANMDAIVAAGDTDGEALVFAGNRLEIAVPAGNPAAVAGLEEFARADLLIGLCAVGVPCGDYGRQALEKAGVVPSVDTDEPNVRALLTKIEAGELDAGIVYVTDVIALNGRVEGIVIPDEQNVLTEYQIATIADGPNPAGSTAFVNFVLSPEGRSILEEYGFVAP